MPSFNTISQSSTVVSAHYVQHDLAGEIVTLTCSFSCLLITRGGARSQGGMDVVMLMVRTHSLKSYVHAFGLGGLVGGGVELLRIYDNYDPTK